MNTRPDFHSNTFPESQRDILGMIASDQHLDEILSAICQMQNALSPDTFCSILLTDAEGKHLLSGAAPGLPAKYSEAIHGMAIGPTEGTCGTAAFRREMVVTEDIAQDPNWERFRSLALGHNLHSCWSVPLLSHEGSVLGTFALYQNRTHTPDEVQIQQLACAAQLAVIAIRHERDGQRLEESEQRFRSLFTYNPNPVFALDLLGNIQSVNPAGLKLKPQTATQFIGHHFSRLVPEEDLMRVSRHFSAARAGAPQRFEARLRDENEKLLTMDISNLPIMVNGEIVGVFGIARDISDQKHFERQLSFNASHDQLTGLLNRVSLEDQLILDCHLSRRRKRLLAVMCIDLDGFKSINDSIGHYFGDQVLVEVARRMAEQVRPGDTIVRMGGDEFIVLLPDLLRDEDVVPVAERLMASIARPYCIQGIDLHVSASVGITLSDGHLEQPMQLIQQADMAMYKAKQQGRNNFQWYTSDLNQRVCEHATLRNDLQKAIETQSLQLHYQPQIDARTGRVVGIEALLRWEHPEKGFIPPAVFVPVAEDSGQIIALSLWVLDTACAQLRLLDEQGITGISMAVNISPMHFQRGHFVQYVQATLDKHGLRGEQLELEITESLLLHNAEQAIETLHRLKALGVRIALDDFGTGFSSLSYLKRLPIDKIKIDRSFIREIATDHHDAAITQGIISMAHHLSLIVVAEGVETASQMEFLKGSRCDIFQGYHFARPMPFAALEEFLSHPEFHR
ncbi:EAL domain-containing protein [Pseudomonas sp. CFBP 13711]|jgi:diguanylate cyclase (GGDEF)-like protein/PAS domain S-box-containing protein|uniref:EAL domain-containing protein n=1 Tax=unclassified Pseudomonas TaxID=196821 RepID=UPI00178453E6|nr:MULTISPECIES: EAL domain-containing protein [unclassified Pseudomonas]MBD8706837.1 EAL domain-containing protein [Pseudomonas sp. CFBP 13711]MBD8713009.1 EAL domain-containing protein [Pseudomonas sp. CFBP 13715]